MRLTKPIQSLIALTAAIISYASVAKAEDEIFHPMMVTKTGPFASAASGVSRSAAISDEKR